MGPAITLAMIARNEEAKLERCLSSLSVAVDEIVVIDTGSQDGTIDVARAHGAKVFSIEWPGAFDVARNVSLDHVKTEWVLWLDADEWLVEGAAEAIRQAVALDGSYGFLLLRRDLLEGENYCEQSLLRLWRHSPQLRFRRAIHEHLSLEELASTFPGQKLVPTNIAFWHDGLQKFLSREKALRNLPLLRKEIQTGPETLYYEIELAQTLKMLGEPEASVIEEGLAEKIVGMKDLDEAPDNTIALFFMRYLADIDEGALRTERTDTLLRLSRGWFSDHPGVRFVAAQVEVRKGDLRAALGDLLEVERMAISGKYDRFTSTNPVMLGTGLSTNLALVAHQLGKKELAQKHYKRLLELEPENQLARQNLRYLS